MYVFYSSCTTILHYEAFGNLKLLFAIYASFLKIHAIMHKLEDRFFINSKQCCFYTNYLFQFCDTIWLHGSRILSCYVSSHVKKCRLRKYIHTYSDCLIASSNAGEGNEVFYAWFFLETDQISEKIHVTRLTNALAPAKIDFDAKNLNCFEKNWTVLFVEVKEKKQFDFLWEKWILNVIFKVIPEKVILWGGMWICNSVNPEDYMFMTAMLIPNRKIYHNSNLLYIMLYWLPRTDVIYKGNNGIIYKVYVCIYCA